MIFNSREYAWSDITLVLGGKVITGVRAIKYKGVQEKDALYGKGNKPRSIQCGNIKYDGEITLLGSELEALKNSSKTRSTLDLQVNATVCYGDPEAGDVMKTDQLIGMQFTEDPAEAKQGDKSMEYPLPFLFLDLISV